MFCPNCGKQISDNSKFCGFCGAVMTPPAAPVAEQPVAVPAEAAPIAEQPVATPLVEQPVAMPVTEQPTMAAPMQPQPQQQMYQQPMAVPMQQPPQGNMSSLSPVPPAEEKKKKKGKAGLIIAIVVLLLVLAGGGVFVFMRMNSPAKKIAAAFASNDIDTVVELYEKVGDKEMDEVVSQAREYAEKLTEGYLDGTGEQDYKTVSNTLSKLQGSVLSGDRELAGWISTIESVEDSRSAFKLAESYKEAGSYVEALGEYAKVIKEDELNYAQAQQAIEETRNLYREAAIKEAKSYEESGNYEKARDVYEEALTVLEGDAQILSAIDDLEAAVVQQAFVEALEEADKAVNEGRYSDAIGIINDAMEIEGISSAQQQALTDKLSEITAEMYVDGTILGTWRMECDFSEAITAEMGSEFENFDAPFIVNIMFEFYEDGTFKMYVEEESFRENFNDWLDELLIYAADIVYDMFGEMGLSKKDADDMVLELYGMTMEEYLKESMMSEMDVEELIEEVLEGAETNGIFRVEEDRLYMAEEEIDENQYDLFHFEEDKLIIEQVDGAEERELLPGITYPFELIREQ